MRYSMKQFALTVALMLSTTMMWAADEVTIVKKLNGITNSSAGTVTSAVSNGKCVTHTALTSPCNNFNR